MSSALRRIPASVVGLLLVAGMALGVSACTNGSDSEPTPDHSPTLSPAPSEPAAPPSASPTPSPDVTPEPTPATPAPTEPALSETTVTVTFWGFDVASASVQVGGYAEVVERDAACTLVLTRGDQEVSTSAPALADASSTTCGTLSIARSQLSAGTWSAVLHYASTTSTGTAQPVTIEVP